MFLEQILWPCMAVYGRVWPCSLIWLYYLENCGLISHYIALYCTISHYIALYRVVLHLSHYIALYRTISHYNASFSRGHRSKFILLLFCLFHHNAYNFFQATFFLLFMKDVDRFIHMFMIFMMYPNVNCENFELKVYQLCSYI